MDTNKYYERLKAIPYPERPKKPRFPTFDSTPAELRQYADEIEAYNKVKAEWLAEHRKFSDKQDEVYAEFKADLLKELGIEKNPKAELLYSIAWQKGHAGGLADVWCEAADLVELIK